MWQAQERTAYGIMFLSHEGKRTRVVTNRRSYGVKIYLKIRWEGVVCIRQAQDSDIWGAIVNTAVPLFSMNCKGFLDLDTKC